ncbi:Cyclohexanone monooxygenase [Patulibacter medicamentivorans]|uniref:Cyclohexanone monooxygenase n=1 Tax=Patulibacter medicamentivorans TaxID=1097667 RepID=H0E5L9_9ACTN|nr:NAD(P)/FAD-dependent oxidoreductase [Patulibacter medicamentivorans]EHN10982.1 Cyclohexanone monooxygenase [Patulibacter medicamentivorans]
MRLDSPTDGPASPTEGPRVAIVGAGMSGICMAIKLRDAGFARFVIFEKADDLGGTWRANRYPGVACDVPSPFYAYSFAPNPGWSRRFAPGDQIHAYLGATAREAGIHDRIRFGTEVRSADFDGSRWWLESGNGEREAFDAVVLATGVLQRPRIPSIEGLERFAGPVAHSAQWRPEWSTAGRRVGVVGSGSTGVQLVTALARDAASVTQFQRTAQWILPVPDHTYSRAWRLLLGRSPRLRRFAYRNAAWQFSLFGRAVIRDGWERRLVAAVCRLNLRTVRDGALRARLTPTDEPMCRRLVMSSGYLRAVQRPHVDVVTDPIERVEPDAVVTRDGRRHQLDALILATGFDAHAFMRPMRISAGDRTLDRAWADGPRAHRTTMLPGFPNLFLLMGPNSPIGNTSLVPIAEGQAEHVVGWIRRIARGELTHVAPTAEATARFNAQLRADMTGTVWVTGCRSWYIGPDGHPTLWPYDIAAFYRMLRRPDDAEYALTVPDRVPVPAPAA